MSGIPAASVDGIDIARIRSGDPDAAKEIERVGQLLLKGEETEPDLLRLCELLYKFGEQRRAEELLVANATEGDHLHALHRRLFGGIGNLYEAAVRAFSEQMGVTLTRRRSSRLYSCFFTCEPFSSSYGTRPDFWDLLGWPSEVLITYEPRRRVVADVYAAPRPGISNAASSRSFSLHYNNDKWIVDTA